MNTQIQSSPTGSHFNSVSYWVAGFALLAGLILSILSWVEICVEHCSANQDYRLFGLPFAIVGMFFFAVLTAFHFFSRSYPLLLKLSQWMVTSALGAEIYFIAVQKYKIGDWCPVCLSIALCLLIAALTYLSAYICSISQQRNRGETTMDKVKKAFTSLSLFAIGLLMAVFGVTKVDPLEAAVDNMKQQLKFGKLNSPVEVYFVSDWFCPSCRKIEPEIEKLCPKIQSKAVFVFVDFPIHSKSMNFSPYNLAFLVHDKENYFTARHMLMNMALKTDTPTDQEVQKAAKDLGIHFKELTFLDVKTGMQYFDDIVTKYDLSSTPTVIITNTKNKKVTKLEGTDEISEEKVLQAVDKLLQS